MGREGLKSIEFLKTITLKIFSCLFENHFINKQQLIINSGVVVVVIVRVYFYGSCIKVVLITEHLVHDANVSDNINGFSVQLMLSELLRNFLLVQR